MTVEHKLVVDFDGDAVFLDGVYLGACTSVGVVTNETVCGECSATITLPQVTLRVLVDEFELCCDQAVVVDASDRAGLLIVELRLVADSVTTILPLLPVDGVREL